MLIRIKEKNDNMDTINKLLWVLVITMVGLCIGFAIFLYKHEKERKKELLKAISNFDNTGQPNKPMHDVTSCSSTASTETPTST